MPSVCVIREKARVRLESQRLKVEGPDETSGRWRVLREIPLFDVERVVLTEGVEVTGAATAELLRRGVPVSWLGWDGGYLGGYDPASPSRALTRLRQYERSRDDAWRAAATARLLEAKIYNQRRLLQRVGASRGLISRVTEEEENDAAVNAGDTGDRAAPELRAGLVNLKRLMRAAARAGSADEARGYEGVASARYWKLWAAFLPPAFPFERRSRRPPLNPVNACLSFGSVMLYREMAGLVSAHGLDAGLGLAHATEDGRWSLALDLMEPFRPVLVEALTLDLFSHQVLRGEHFEAKGQGVYLNGEGRRRFILHYEKRMERQFYSESAKCRTTLRRQLDAQAGNYKAALDEPGRHAPFRMN